MLTSQAGRWGSKCELSAAFCEKLYKTELVDRVVSLADYHDTKKLAAWILSLPVMTMTRMPARVQSLMASFTSGRGGSLRPASPRNTMPLSISGYLF
jgi:hypothetical protein